MLKKGYKLTLTKQDQTQHSKVEMYYLTSSSYTDRRIKANKLRYPDKPIKHSYFD